LLIQSQIFFPLNSHKDPIDQKEEREGEEKKKKKAPFFFFVKIALRSLLCRCHSSLIMFDFSLFVFNKVDVAGVGVGEAPVGPSVVPSVFG
jgi:hypothetical protein